MYSKAIRFQKMESYSYFLRKNKKFLQHPVKTPFFFCICERQKQKNKIFCICPLHFTIWALFKTGLRISEFCGLTVRDLDFKNEVIRIDHQLQRTRDMKYEIVSTKTTSGTRLLPMEEDVKDAFLRILKNRKKTKKEPTVDGYGGFLFLDKNGNPMVALHWEKYMQHAREKYNKELDKNRFITPKHAQITHWKRIMV